MNTIHFKKWLTNQYNNTGFVKGMMVLRFQKAVKERPRVDLSSNLEGFAFRHILTMVA